MFTKIAHVTPGRLSFVIVALQPSPERIGPDSLLPVVAQNITLPRRRRAQGADRI